ncbi:hypothetical protein Vretimale_4326 [Volvox reticuliferus]|uniref:Transmembrane protein n=1 Tax=Volvox reticuliferus TaxID=1737510 RepID=A0A8J4FFH5_9CHLO|nr:hypothetical protein Vretifemale_2912 [Volvox reticuliferus]GIL99072.1 hypothetical protein Vretimale_4326 [Volvox reticuliferus]
MANINNKLILIIVVVFALIGWLVALGGIAKANDVCNNRYGFTNKNCSDDLSYHWWGIWFSFVLAVVILILAILGKAEAWSSTLQALCAACLSVTMLDADSIYKWNVQDWATDWVHAALAGFIILSIALMLLIIILGMNLAGENVSVRVSPAPGSIETASKQPKQGDTSAC